jgi:hypothetical protein
VTDVTDDGEIVEESRDHLLGPRAGRVDNAGTLDCGHIRRETVLDRQAGHGFAVRIDRFGHRVVRDGGSVRVGGHDRLQARALDEFGLPVVGAESAPKPLHGQSELHFEEAGLRSPFVVGHRLTAPRGSIKTDDPGGPVRSPGVIHRSSPQDDQPRRHSHGLDGLRGSDDCGAETMATIREEPTERPVVYEVRLYRRSGSTDHDEPTILVVVVAHHPTVAFEAVEVV